MVQEYGKCGLCFYFKLNWLFSVEYGSNDREGKESSFLAQCGGPVRIKSRDAFLWFSNVKEVVREVLNTVWTKFCPRFELFLELSICSR